MKTSYLMGLLVLGFVMLMIGWPWWLGVGLIVLSMAAAVSGGEEEPQKMPMTAMTAKTAMASAAKKADVDAGFDAWDMKWSPTTFADGMMGVNPMADKASGSAVGSRSGAFAQDMGPIRFKDDIRFRITGDAGDFYKMCELDTPDGPKALTAWDFRTRKDVFPGLHIGSVKTVTSPDDFANPGLGSPNEWLKKLKKQ